jgi:transposase
MRAYRRLRVRLKRGDREKLHDILSGGVQPVRTVLRALALGRLHEGQSVSEVAVMVRLTPKAVREIGRRYRDGGLEQALYDKPRPGAAPLLDPSQRQRIIGMVCSDPP